MPTKRSGFTHVRVCLDCKMQIDEVDHCACPNQHPFTKGALVTVCADEACAAPLRLGAISKHGNGSFRLEGTEHW